MGSDDDDVVDVHHIFKEGHKKDRLKTSNILQLVTNRTTFNCNLKLLFVFSKKCIPVLCTLQITRTHHKRHP